ncbi:hypothetical protein CP967_26610 [Streptomyces nitrosporeus]|uniref:Uncharacterized protein n=1 Tax=Streptomyces nitrosporeus TaxID=28894 RepID=A0A5J6FGB8_9ACTN|nr:hypothetical protein [Streptomyces nitrosporeus]QEU75081.1 hypothetical protein CP967_26610 [Streptomyces nitrosporeus]GGY91084.1 hypothetical protein GCM10010327_22240 [Streptomyces nitrosporeus]
MRLSVLTEETTSPERQRDAEGNQVMATAEPIMTREEFDRIGAVLDSRSIDNKERKDTDT